MIDPLDTPLTVIPREAHATVHAPGVPSSGCITRRCTVHTSDWRFPLGSPQNLHRVEAGPVATIREVLSRRYATEALCMGYVIARDGRPLSHSPRVSKDALEWLRKQGYDVLTTCFIADVDTPPPAPGMKGHVPWTAEMLAEFERTWATAPLLQTCAAYRSPRGYRVLQPLSRWLPVDEAEPRQLAWLHALRAQGVWESALECKDWTHLMRVPHHRKKGMNVVSEWVSTERMIAVEPPAPFEGGRPVRVQRRAHTQPAATGVVNLPQWSDACPPGWEAVANALGAALRDYVSADWRRCYLALAGALLARGCDPGGVPAVVARAHSVDQSYPEWEALLGDRVDIARTTVVRWASGQPVSGVGDLRARWPRVADALDETTTSGAEARVLKQLAAAPPADVPVAEAVAAIRDAVRNAYGVTVIEAPPGTGKTQSMIARSEELPPIVRRAAPGSRIAVSAPRHNLAQQTARKAKKALHLFSPPSMIDHATQSPVCAYAEAARQLAAGRQSVRREICDGRNKHPCQFRSTCRAYSGMEGDESANLVVGVHELVRELRAYAGPAGTLVIDEPKEIVVTDRVTLDDLDTASRYLDSFEPRYARAISPALRAFAAWVREVGVVEAPIVSVQEAVRASVNAVDADDLVAADIDPTTLAADLGDAILVAAAGAIPGDARWKAPRLEQRSITLALANSARASEIGRASRVLDLLWRAITSRVVFGARIEDRSGERSALVVSINADLLCALEHEGPVVVLDAEASLHLPAITKVLGHAPRLVQLSVADGAPIARSVLACGSANRRWWMPRGVPDWPAILPSLRAAMAWAAEDSTTRKVGLIVPKEVETGVLFALRPDDPVSQKLVRDSRVPRSTLEKMRGAIATALTPFRGEIVTGHFGDLEGLDHMADCDATITLGDPRPNLGDVRLKAEFLGLDPEGRADDLASAELGQAHGRLRTIHRTRTGRQLHVGSIVPAGWAGRAVDVRRLPVGRPRAVPGMSAEEFRAARESLGLSQAAMAKALGCSAGAIKHYEAGRAVVDEATAMAVVDEATARAVQALGSVGSRTPYRDSA